MLPATGICIDTAKSTAPKQWFCAYGDLSYKRSCYIAKNKQDAISYAKTLLEMKITPDIWVSYVWKADYDKHGAKGSIGDLFFTDTEQK